VLSVAILFSILAVSPELLAEESGKKPTLVGWRGNWTGKFPEANPPVKWSKISKQMKGLRCQAEKPENDKPGGVSVYTGSLTEWLVLGPFLAAEDKKEAIDEEFIKDEASCEPRNGEVVKGVRWKKVEVAGSLVNFASILARDMPDGTPTFRTINSSKESTPYFGKPFVAYAQTWVYSPMATTLRFRIRSCLAAKVYINGELIQGLKFSAFNRSETAGEFSAKLNKGWNRVLCKVRNYVMNKEVWRMRSWYFDLGLRAIQPYETESEGIAWAALLPSYHVACPFIVGDKIFVMSKPGDLICLRKRDGRALWIGSTTYYNLLSDKDKRDNPDLAKAAAEVEPLVEKIKEIHAAYVKQGKLSVESMNERIRLHDQITKLMGKADKKYSGRPGHHADGTMPTPVSDGKHIYVWSELGIATCYDLDGKRKWLAMPGVRSHESGDRTSSPTIADGKMVVYDGSPRGLGHPERQKGAPTGKLVAFDARSGAVAWSTPIGGNPVSSLVPVRIGGDDFVYVCGYLVRGRDGKIMIASKRWQGEGIPTPVIENGTIYGIAVETKLPTDPGNMVMGKSKGVGVTGAGVSESWIASPLYHEGLLYVVDPRGTLSVIDLEAQKLVYQRYLGAGKDWPYKFYYAHDWGWGVVYASPILAGKQIYVFAMNGTTVVFKPGRKYEEVARNKIEDYLLASDGGYHMKGAKMLEHFASSPVAEGEHIYVRGGNYLYCLGKAPGRGR